jgi:hypothetical protein
VIFGKILVFQPFWWAFPASWRGVLSAAIFFSAKKSLKKGFPLQSLTQIE